MKKEKVKKYVWVKDVLQNLSLVALMILLLFGCACAGILAVRLVTAPSRYTHCIDWCKARQYGGTFPDQKSNLECFDQCKNEK